MPGTNRAVPSLGLRPSVTLPALPGSRNPSTDPSIFNPNRDRSTPVTGPPRPPNTSRVGAGFNPGNDPRRSTPQSTLTPTNVISGGNNTNLPYWAFHLYGNNERTIYPWSVAVSGPNYRGPSLLQRMRAPGTNFRGGGTGANQPITTNTTVESPTLADSRYGGPSSDLGQIQDTGVSSSFDFLSNPIFLAAIGGAIFLYVRRKK